MTIRDHSQSPAASSSTLMSRADRTGFVSASLLLYTHLWIIEGAIRKWLPGTDTFMYVARDALLVLSFVVLVLISARRSRSLAVAWAFGLGLFVVAMIGVIAGATNFPVAVAGLRAYVAPVLAVYVYFCYRPANIERRIAQTILVYVPVQLVIAIVQASSPRDATINRQVSGEEAHFVSEGIVRISGTFSSPSGASAFTIISFAIIVGSLLARERLFGRVAMVLLAVMTIGIALLSGARGTLLGLAIVLAFVLLAAVVRDPGRGLRTAATVGVGVAGVYVVVAAAWPDVLAAFVARFEQAARTEDTLARIAYQTFGFLSPEYLSLFGGGIGSRSQVGISLGSGQEWVEVDTVKWVYELGVLGLILAVVRVGLAFSLLLRTLLRSRADGWYRVALFGAMSPILAYGSITQTPSDQAAIAILAILAIGAGEVSRARGEPLPLVKKGLVGAR